MIKNPQITSNGASIVIDANDTIHISYSFRTNHAVSLFYSTCSSSCSSASSWSEVQVVAGGWYNDIAIDTNGTLHISHGTTGTLSSSLQHSTCSSSCSTASSWTTTSITSVNNVLSSISMTTDSNNSIHILYREGYGSPTFDLNYATCSSGCTSTSSWSTVEIDASTTSSYMSRQSIAVDSNNGIHITYGLNGNLTYATCSSSCTSASSWTNTTVDTGSPNGMGEIALDSNEHLYISYGKGSSFAASKLAYATCSSSCTSSSSWTNTTFNTTGGTERGLALDSNDRVHISYHTSSTDKSLRYLAIEPSSIVYAYSISPALPAGLSLEISTGEISGTPTELSTNTTYTITVRNSGGVNTTTITIEVVDQVPTVAYSPADLTLTNNTVSSDLPLSPTITGSGEIVTWAINASLPSGLTFGTNNGTIYGTPTELWTQTSYMVWANNSGGSSVAYLNITVVDELPTLSYSPSSLALTKDNQSSDLPLNATLTGPGDITSWEINATLPAGLNFGTSNGTIWGIPTVLQTTATTYTIWANNTGGSTSATVTITIIDEAPSISYAYDDIVGTLNVSISPHSNPTNTGGAVTSWEISPYPGPAFHFNTLNGVISGTPGVLLSTTQYTVYANNSGGSSIAYVNVTINPDAPNISYSPNELNLTKYLSSSDLPLSPTNTGGYTQTTALCSSSGTPNLFVVSDHEGTRHVLCGTTLYSIDLNGTQTVSTNHVTGTAFGLEIDDDGHLHIGHWTYNYPYVSIHHATNKNGSWQSSNVHNFGIGGSVGYDNQGFSMAVGSDDSIHFTYIRVTNAGNTDNLYHLSNQSGSWSSALLTNQNKPGEPSLTLNNDNVPHVAFTAGNSFSVGKYESGSYTTLLSRSNYMEPDIVIDAQGDVHVVYRTGSYGLYYSTNASGSWQHTSLDTTARHFDGRIALDSNEYPHVMTASVSGQNNNYRLVNYYSHDGSSWNGGSITSEINLQQPRPDIYIDDNDVISTVYHDGTYGNLFTGTGSTIYGYSVSPALPSGLTFSQSTGTISGVPVVQMNRTMFTITANNSGGSSTAYINITVNDRMPSFTYNPENLTLTNNTVSNDLPLVPATHYSGDAPTDWVLMGTLPAGLNFGTNNGTIWGTPTELWTTTNYTVYGNNTGGSFNVSINITVNDEVPTLSYSPANLTLYNNTASSDLPLNATLTGSGDITSWTIAPDLPNGLTFEPSNGTIWGIPTQRLTTTQFTIWANNSGGSTTASLNITVLHEAPMFNYSSYNLTLVNNTAMAMLSPSITGGEITSWAIEETIPTGLTLDSISGAISGTPTAVQNRTMYQIWANNSGGSHSVYLNITIYDPAVDLQYNPQNLTLTRDVTMSDLVPIYSGIVDDWTIVPGLPSGLVFTDGLISGTPDVNMTRTTYTVWANNSGGSSSHTVNITILEPIAMLDYNPENMTLVRGTQMSDMVPTVSGGMVEFWSIHPDLPAGLLFDNGTVSGTPTVNMTTSMFTVYANNTGGSASHTINLTILEPSGDLSYTNITLTRNVSMAPLSPTYSGGVVEVWAIHPALPNGLNFSNGVISGTPLVNLSTYMFTVYANNSGGVASATVNITILEPIVTLVYNPDNRTLIRGVTMSPMYPSVSGGSVEEWGIEPAPPLGITFANGVFSGTPVNNMTQTQYQVFANTTGGSATAWVNITVLEPAVNLTYDPYNITLIRNQTMLPVTPTIEGGSVEFWAIEPDLPAGLVFSEGTISGMPQVNMTTKMFTVWANTTGGASSATLNITIVEPLGVLTYDPSNLTLTRDAAMATLEPNLTMGVPSSWEIEPELPQGLVFNNGYISGTPTVNMTHTVYTVWANHSGGSASAVISITVNEPLPIIGFTPDSIILMRYEAMNNSTSISDGGFVETWSISPDLPDGLVFTNGTVSGTPLVNMTATMFTITAINTGGSVNTSLTITVLEPPANLSIEVDEFVLTRGEDELNFTINNSGGFIATWEVEPALPLGVSLIDGVVHGTPLVNSTQVSYTVWANNTGGNVTIQFNLTVLEPIAIIEYPPAVVELVNGVSAGYIVPMLTGGQPASWEIYPDLPEGMELVNGLIVGVPESNLSETVFTVWANNTGGSSQANFTLEINQPFFIARYPETIIVLDVNESIGSLAPLYYFDETDEPLWTIFPELPEGMTFTNGTITGVGLLPQNLTMYTVQVTGEMVPVTFTLMIEIIGVEFDAGIPSMRNETTTEPYVVPEPEPEPKFDFDAYWMCPIIAFLLLLLAMMAVTRFLKEDEQPELVQAEADDEDEDS